MSLAAPARPFVVGSLLVPILDYTDLASGKAELQVQPDDDAQPGNEE